MKIKSQAIIWTFLFIFSILNISMVYSSPTITLVSPGNNSNITLSNSSQDFVFNYVDSVNSTMNCTLMDILSGSSYSTQSSNTSTINNTNTTLRYTTNYTLGNHNWTVYCVRDSNSAYSFNYTFTYQQLVIYLNYSSFSNNLTSTFSLLNISNLTNPYIGKTNVGQINFSGSNINLLGYDLDTNINISNNYIFVNTSNLTNLSNVPANVTFFNLNYAKSPVIYSIDYLGNRSLCATNCSVLNYLSGTLLFNVLHFSGYVSGPNSNLVGYDQTDLEGGRIPAYVNNTVSFYANYTNVTSGASITGANCRFYFSNGTNYSMTYNSGSGVYLYTTNFSSPTTFYYNITCNQSSFEFLNITNSINVTLSNLNPPFLWSVQNYTNTQNLFVVGYTNNSNSTLTVFSTGNGGNSFNQTSINLTINVTVYGASSVYGLSGNNSVVWVNYDSDGVFSVGRYIYFSGHNRTYFKGYNITTVQNAPDNSYTLVSVSPSLESSIIIGEGVSVTNSSIPLGWFNVSLGLFSGQNQITSFLSDQYNFRSINSPVQSVYYYSSFPFINLSQINNVTGSNINILNFNISDEFSLNFSTLLLNITNSSGNHIYYTYSPSIYNITSFGTINCNGANNSNCSVTVNLTNGYYNLTFSVKNMINQLSNSSIVNYLVDTINPTSPTNISAGAYATNSQYLNVSWIQSSANSGVAYYEYAVGTSIGSNNTYGWNRTTFTSAYIGPLNMVSNTMYYISVRAVSNSNLISAADYTDILFFDSTGPIVYNLDQSLRFSNSANFLPVNWSAYDNESTLSSFDIIITKNTNYPWVDDSVIFKQFNLPSGSARYSNIDFSLFNLAMEYNVTYFTTIYGINDMGIRSSVPGTASNGTTFDNTAPENISLRYSSGRIANNNLTLEVDPGFDYVSGINKYVIESSTSDYVNGLCSGSISSFASFYEKNISTPSNINKNPSDDNISLTLQSGKCYQFRLIVYNNAGGFSAVYNSATAIDDNVSVDSTNPAGFSVYDTVGSKDSLGLMTLSGGSLTITWGASSDLESGIGRYSIWVTEQAYGGPEQPFSPYTSSSPLNLLPSDISEYQSGVLQYTLSNLSLNLSNHTDPTHQFKYRVYVKAWNGNNLSVQSNSDGIIYIDNVAPSLSLLWVENQSQISSPFFDTVQNNFTTVVVRGESGMDCQWNNVDEGYKDVSVNKHDCTVSSSNATCLINETSDGVNFYHISCKDRNGNFNTAIDNLDFNVTLDFTSPLINITSPTLPVYSSTQINVNFTVFDYTFSNAWIVINSPSGILVNQTVIPSSNSSNNFYFSYVFNVPSGTVYNNYTLTVYSNDSSSLFSNKSASFVYDNSTSSFDLTLDSSIYSSSFNMTLDVNHVRNISWNITKTTNPYTLIQAGTTTSNYTSSILKQLINVSAITDDGNYTITVRYTNDINLSGLATKTFLLDKTAPLIHTPIFYLNDTNVKDILLEINTTNIVFGHNITMTGISKVNKNIVINVDNNVNFTLNFVSNSSVLMGNFGNITLSLLLPYYINNSFNLHDSKIIARVYNSSYDIPKWYTSGSSSSFYSQDINRLLINDSLDVNLSVEDYLGAQTVSYQIYDEDNSNATRFVNSLVSFATSLNQSYFRIFADFKTLMLTANKNFTLKVTSTDSVGNTGVNYYNFTFIKLSQPSLLTFNLSQNLVRSSSYHTFYLNSTLTINVSCNNSDELTVNLFNGSDVLLYSNESTGQSIINLNGLINYAFNDRETYYLASLCKTNMNTYSSDYYILKYDTSSPVITFVNPLIESSGEYMLKQSDSDIFENLTISVENITSTSALIKVNDFTSQNSYQSLIIGQNTTFYGSGNYHIRLLNTYYDPINSSNNFASFRITKNSDIEQISGQNANIMINSSGYYIYKSGNISLYYSLNDFSTENIRYNITLIKTSDNTTLLNNTELYASIIYGTLTPYNYINGVFYNLTLNLDNLGVNKTLSTGANYQLKIVSIDILNQSSTKIFNFTVLTRTPYFVNPTNSFNNTVILNKEDYYLSLSAMDLDNDNLTYGIKAVSSNITAIILNNTNVLITSNNNYVGAAWIIFNVSDGFGGYNETGNFTLNITNSTGPLTLLFNSNLSLSVTFRSNILLPDYGTSIGTYQNYNSSVRSAIPSNLNTSVVDVVIRLINSSTDIILKNINLSSQSILNLTYISFDKSSVTKSLFMGGNYTIQDAFIFKIDNSTYSGNYTVVRGYNESVISDSIASSYLKIFKMDINLTNNNISYDSALATTNSNIDTSQNLIWGTYSNFSLFVLALNDAGVTPSGSGGSSGGSGSSGSSGSSSRSSGSSGGGSSGALSAASSSPTCSDNIKNQNEIGTDCGGVCSGYWYLNNCHLLPLATCNDGIINQDETNIDCGGVCQTCAITEQPKDINSCNGYWYSDSCHTLPQTTCSDNIKNQNEDGVDCGGVCQTSCKNNLISTVSNYKDSIFFTLGVVMLIIVGVSTVAAFRKHSTLNNPLAAEPSASPFEEFTTQPEGDFMKIEVKEDYNINDLEKISQYITKEQSKGILNNSIKNSLLSAQWSEDLIDKAFEKTDSARRLLALESYIKKAKAAGISEEKIREVLIGAEWAEHFIDMVLHEVHVIHTDFDKVKKYAENMILKGYTKEDVLKTLLDAGWQKEAVEPYIE